MWHLASTIILKVAEVGPAAKPLKQGHLNKYPSESSAVDLTSSLRRGPQTSARVSDFQGRIREASPEAETVRRETAKGRPEGTERKPEPTESDVKVTRAERVA